MSNQEAPLSPEEIKKKQEFLIEGETTKTVTGRREAVAAAKEMSLERGGTVRMERSDGQEVMDFVNGDLVAYRSEAGGRSAGGPGGGGGDRRPRL